MMRVTILEFAPCADSIFHVRRDAQEGYISSDGQRIAIAAGSKLRPRLISTYAGGKATNVARVMDALLRADDSVDIELVVFRPDSAEGRYIHDLQSGALKRVRIRPVILEASARFCIDITDPRTTEEDRVEFNLSPRVSWSDRAYETGLAFAREIESDLLLMAGNPPVLAHSERMAENLYVDVISEVRSRVGSISLDTEKAALANCVRSSAAPDVIKINQAEYAGIDAGLWDGFRGMLVVTDSRGCSVWPSRAEASMARVDGIERRAEYSTIGAGDAMHAGFALARWVRGFGLERAARYGQAAAAASIAAMDGTRGVVRNAVEELFTELEGG